MKIQNTPFGSNPFKRSIATFTAALFLSMELLNLAPSAFAQSSVIDQVHGGNPPTGLSRLVRDAEIRIPPELGKIDEIYFPRDGKRVSSDSPSVVFIQDAHDSLEAQENIAKIIQGLVTDHGVKTVFEEGFEGRVPTDDYFGFIKDPELKRKVAYFFLDHLRVGGAEYAHINRQSRLVDSPQSTDHSQNMAQDRGPLTVDHGLDFDLIGADSLKLHKENIAQYRLSNAQKIAIAKDLKALGKELRELADGRFPKEFKAWLKVREQFASKKLDLFTYLGRTASLFRPQTKKQPSTVDRGPWTGLLQFILEAVKSSDPVVIEKAKHIDAREVFGELVKLDGVMADRWLTSAADKELFGYHKVLGLLARLNDLEVTQEEYEAVRKDLETFDTHSFGIFIHERLKKPLVLSKKWERNIREALKFYEIAALRDRAVSQALDSHLKGTGTAPAVLVYGGFHKENIKRILEAKGIRYIVVSPRITKPSPRHEEFYKKLMIDGAFPFEKTIRPLIATATRNPTLYDGIPVSIARAEVHEVYDVIRNGAKPGTEEKYLEDGLAGRGNMPSNGPGRGDIEENARKLAAGNAAAGVKDLNPEHPAVLGDVHHNAVRYLAGVFDLSRLKLYIERIRVAIKRYLHQLDPFFKPIGRYQNDRHLFAFVNDRQNLITEPFISQTPSAAAYFGPVGAGHSLFDLFRDKFSLGNSLMGVLGIYKFHNKYNNYSTLNVKGFPPSRSESRVPPKPEWLTKREEEGYGEVYGADGFYHSIDQALETDRGLRTLLSEAEVLVVIPIANEKSGDRTFQLIRDIRTHVARFTNKRLRIVAIAESESDTARKLSPHQGDDFRIFHKNSLFRGKGWSERAGIYLASKAMRPEGAGEPLGSEIVLFVDADVKFSNGRESAARLMNSLLAPASSENHAAMVMLHALKRRYSDDDAFAHWWTQVITEAFYGLHFHQSHGGEFALSRDAVQALIHTEKNREFPVLPSANVYDLEHLVMLRLAELMRAGYLPSQRLIEHNKVRKDHTEISSDTLFRRMGQELIPRVFEQLLASNTLMDPKSSDAVRVFYDEKNFGLLFNNEEIKAFRFDDHVQAFLEMHFRELGILADIQKNAGLKPLLEGFSSDELQLISSAAGVKSYKDFGFSSQFFARVTVNALELFAKQTDPKERIALCEKYMIFVKAAFFDFAAKVLKENPEILLLDVIKKQEASYFVDALREAFQVRSASGLGQTGSTRGGTKDGPGRSEARDFPKIYGTFEAGVDNKSRIAVPAHWKESLPASAKVLVMPAGPQKIAVVPRERWEEEPGPTEEGLELDPLKYASVYQANLDASRRLVLSRTWLEIGAFFEIGSQVAFSGAGDGFILRKMNDSIKDIILGFRSWKAGKISGTFEVVMDGKERISIPSDWKEVFPDGAGVMFMAEGPQKMAVIPLDRWEKHHARILQSGLELAPQEYASLHSTKVASQGRLNLVRAGKVTGVSFGDTTGGIMLKLTGAGDGFMIEKKSEDSKLEPASAQLPPNARSEMRSDVPLGDIFRDGAFNYDRILLLQHWKRIKAILEGKIIWPYEVEIQPSTHCNLNCAHCIGKHLFGVRRPYELDPVTLGDFLRQSVIFPSLALLFSKIHPDLDPDLLRIKRIKFSGLIGEPLMADIGEGLRLLVDYNKQVAAIPQGPIELGLFTNGILLFDFPEIVNHLLDFSYVHVSLDADSSTTFLRTKKGRPENFDKILANIESLVHMRNTARSPLKVNVGYVLSKYNYEGLSEILERLKSMGVDIVRVKMDLGNDPQTGMNERDIHAAYDRIEQAQLALYGEGFEVAAIHSRQEALQMPFRINFPRCYTGYFMATFAADGRFYACDHQAMFHRGIRDDKVWQPEFDARKQCKICPPFAYRINRLMNYLADKAKEDPGFLLQFEKEIVDPLRRSDSLARQDGSVPGKASTAMPLDRYPRTSRSETRADLTKEVRDRISKDTVLAPFLNTSGEFPEARELLDETQRMKILGVVGKPGLFVKQGKVDNENGSLLAEAKALLPLSGIAGIPQLLKIDVDEKDGTVRLLLQSIPNGIALSDPGQLRLYEIPLSRRFELMFRVVKILEKAYERGYVHNDLRPANILYNPVNYDVAVIDWELASKAGTNAMEPTANRRYIAPVQPKNADTDIYSLAQILKELMLGTFVEDREVKMLIERMSAVEQNRQQGIPVTFSEVLKGLKNLCERAYKIDRGIPMNASEPPAYFQNRSEARMTLDEARGIVNRTHRKILDEVRPHKNAFILFRDAGGRIAELVAIAPFLDVFYEAQVIRTLLAAKETALAFRHVNDLIQAREERLVFLLKNASVHKLVKFLKVLNLYVLVMPFFSYRGDQAFEAQIITLLKRIWIDEVIDFINGMPSIQKILTTDAPPGIPEILEGYFVPVREKFFHHAAANPSDLLRLWQGDDAHLRSEARTITNSKGETLDQVWKRWGKFLRKGKRPFSFSLDLGNWPKHSPEYIEALMKADEAQLGKELRGFAFDEPVVLDGIFLKNLSRDMTDAELLKSFLDPISDRYLEERKSSAMSLPWASLQHLVGSPKGLRSLVVLLKNELLLRKVDKFEDFMFVMLMHWIDPSVETPGIMKPLRSEVRGKTIMKVMAVGAGAGLVTYVLKNIFSRRGKASQKVLTKGPERLSPSAQEPSRTEKFSHFKDSFNDPRIADNVVLSSKESTAGIREYLARIDRVFKQRPWEFFNAGPHGVEVEAGIKEFFFYLRNELSRLKNNYLTKLRRDPEDKAALEGLTRVRKAARQLYLAARALSAVKRGELATPSRVKIKDHYTGRDYPLEEKGWPGILTIYILNQYAGGSREPRFKIEVEDPVTRMEFTSFRIDFVPGGRFAGAHVNPPQPFYDLLGGDDVHFGLDFFRTETEFSEYVRALDQKIAGFEPDIRRRHIESKVRSEMHLASSMPSTSRDSLDARSEMRDEAATLREELEKKGNADALMRYLLLLADGTSLMKVKKERADFSKSFYEPLLTLFLTRLEKDFDGAEEFVGLCRGRLEKGGSLALLEALGDTTHPEFLNAFKKIRVGNTTSKASIGFYGLSLFFLIPQSIQYFEPLYDVAIQTRPVEELSFGKDSDMWHSRSNGVISFYGLGTIFHGVKATYLKHMRPWIGESTPEDRTQSSENQKIRRAFEILSEWAKTKGVSMQEAVQNFMDEVTVLEVDNIAETLFSEVEANTIHPMAAGRSRNVIYLPSGYLRSQDILDAEDMKELAILLRFAMRFHEAMNMSDSEEERFDAVRKLNGNFFRDEDTGLLPLEDLRRRFSDSLKRNTIIKYTWALLDTLEREDDVTRRMEKISDPTTSVPDHPNILRDAYSRYAKLLARYGGLGLSSQTVWTFQRMENVVDLLILEDVGVSPASFPMNMIFAAVRFGLWDGFAGALASLAELLEKPMDENQRVIFKYTFSVNFLTEIRRVLHRQFGVLSPAHRIGIKNVVQNAELQLLRIQRALGLPSNEETSEPGSSRETRSEMRSVVIPEELTAPKEATLQNLERLMAAEVLTEQDANFLRSLAVFFRYKNSAVISAKEMSDDKKFREELIKGLSVLVRYFDAAAYARETSSELQKRYTEVAAKFDAGTFTHTMGHSLYPYDALLALDEALDHKNSELTDLINEFQSVYDEYWILQGYIFRGYAYWKDPRLSEYLIDLTIDLLGKMTLVDQKAFAFLNEFDEGKGLLEEMCFHSIKDVHDKAKEAEVWLERIRTWKQTGSSSEIKQVSVKDLKETIEQSSNELASLDVTVSVSNADRESHVLLSKLDLLYLSENLVTNAADAKSNKLSVRISMETISGRNYVAVAYTDNGTGMPKDVLERIQRGDSHSTKGIHGKGKGVPIIFEIVRNAGGTVSVDSELGKGTTFTFKLPLAVSQSDEKQLETHATPQNLSSSSSDLVPANTGILRDAVRSEARTPPLKAKNWMDATSSQDVVFAIDGATLGELGPELYRELLAVKGIYGKSLKILVTGVVTGKAEARVGELSSRDFGGNVFIGDRAPIAENAKVIYFTDDQASDVSLSSVRMKAKIRAVFRGVRAADFVAGIQLALSSLLDEDLSRKLNIRDIIAERLGFNAAQALETLWSAFTVISSAA